MTVTCQNRISQESVIGVQGSTLEISNSSINDCQSNADGGFIQSYDNAVVTVDSCNFSNLHSNGLGGAIASLGSNLSISHSSFSNCSSNGGGGAVWSSELQACFGSLQIYNTSLLIKSSKFIECSTRGSGGAVLADSSESSQAGEVLDVRIVSSQFSKCNAATEGGAFRASGGRLQAIVVFSEFEFSIAGSLGGAVSAGEFCSLSLVSCKMLLPLLPTYHLYQPYFW